MNARERYEELLEGRDRVTIMVRPEDLNDFAARLAENERAVLAENQDGTKPIYIKRGGSEFEVYTFTPRTGGAPIVFYRL